MRETRLSVDVRFVLLVGIVLLGTAVSASAAQTATFAADCITPQTTFMLGDTVCAKATGLTNQRIAWVDPDGFIVAKTDIVADPQTDSFALPATDQSNVFGVFTANNLGTWRVNGITSRNSVQATATFTVKDPAHQAVDLSITNSIAGSETPSAGGTIQFVIAITNQGPDDATSVRMLDNTFTNANFSSITQTGGPAFSCSGADCTIATFANGARATFLLTFTAGAAGGVLENTATVSSTGNELNPDDNSSTAAPVQVGTNGTPPACSVQCPNNMVVSATTTQNNVLGAFVTLPTPDATGTCGTVTLNPPSGSFFPVGMTTVTASESGGGSCSFTVNVIDTPPPTISCPASITVTALSGQPNAFIPDPNGVASNPGNPTTTGSNVAVNGERSDDESLSGAYPIGVTTIHWTVTDDGGRTASCNQTITVISPDAPSIHCPSDKTFTAPNGSCTISLSASDIGTPVTSGLNVTVTPSRSDHLAFTDPYPSGDTFITWTAENTLGSASCVQRIHVNSAADSTPPSLTVPPDVFATTSSCTVLLDDELGVATASDTCGSVSLVRTGVPPDFIFPTGITIITYTAVDAAGNKTTGQQRVTVLESPAIRPSLTPPADVVAYTGPGATSCGVVVSTATLGTATATDNCPGVTVARTGVPSGNFFPVGTTNVTYTATDASGNTSSAVQQVTVIDNTPPALTCPQSITLEPTCPTGAVATWTAPIGTDNCTVTTSQTAGPASGSVFPIGATTTVGYTATDGAGNQASCSFTVTVLSIPATLQNLITSVQASTLNGPERQGLLAKLQTAQSTLGFKNSTPVCQSLSNFSNSVQNYMNQGIISAAQGNAWLSTAKHLMNAIGCTNDPCS